MDNYEHCCECDGWTGRAGKGDDSLYAGNYGPYCEDCWGDVPGMLADKVDDLRSINRQHRDDMEKLFAENVELKSKLASRDAVIKDLREDLRYCRKDRRDQMIQDQGLPERQICSGLSAAMNC